MIDDQARSDTRLLTRRGLLKGAGGVAGLVALGGAAFGATHVFRGRHRVTRLHSFASPVGGPVRAFVSRPDLHPPAVAVMGGHVAPGYLFVGPSVRGTSQAGPLLLDDQGEPVWFRPISRGLWASNFRRGHYRGQPVLSWWEGRMTAQGLGWFGRGEAVIVDSSYREVARVRAANGR